ncbi:MULTISPECIES: hypothetical protein [unclassified Lentilitoribacter]|jgi:Sec-independent protein secretion pathway component TatC|uniref:hypothetical protein n=1 Tax=unclassified Lentilitoribacter TaxID=2647570 RepID=UPI0013A6E468|nr:hypothetical protein [Lentilitoribacter sp. Alg239-R112]
MLSKIIIILLGITLLIMFAFMEKRLNAIFKGRSKLFYIGTATAGLAILAIINLFDLIYILIGLVIIGALIAIAPWLVDRWPRR